ncbi:hypothetical protein BWI96_20875 [Siphonobacter sp. SORGH_AS_0500]|uniref:dsDNA nuclease domain-containing protein n=1 Tax=Siphonobacter sp. SORGH_AS_0500 TaxID=1864824 RepID=UPI000CB79AA2|nr:dsDNA nuclease domain-containing protein [Siphonobacter sp. SORGH_AS_0500]PKK34683.1 hypothetical protein BWI96_20875 [Siphonobacter sp. SORGH_AS_0500]
MEEDNPLFEPQREKMGSISLGRFDYQYHWAIDKIIELHYKGEEYIIFMETHEDVVLADSIDPKKVKFDFNQVKATEKEFTEHKLIKIEEKDKNSVLGKMFISSSKPKFRKLIRNINLVSASGFKIRTLDPELKLTCINTCHLTDNVIDYFIKALNSELQLDKLPDNLGFINSTLPITSSESTVVGNLSRMIENVYPKYSYKSHSIFASLAIELHRKGTDIRDYPKWKEFVFHKGVTFTTVDQLIKSLIVSEEETSIMEDFDLLVVDFEFKGMKAVKFKNAFRNYYQNRYSLTLTKLSLIKEIRNAIINTLDKEEEDIIVLLSLVKAILSNECVTSFESDDKLNCAIICEYLILQKDGK